jgi:hypothetical protein
MAVGRGKKFGIFSPEYRARGGAVWAKKWIWGPRAYVALLTSFPSEALKHPSMRKAWGAVGTRAAAMPSRRGKLGAILGAAAGLGALGLYLRSKALDREAKAWALQQRMAQAR